MRGTNCLIASAGVMVGAYLSHQSWLTTDSIITAAAVFLVCGGGNCLNDGRDVEIDSISHPDRVLVTGKLPVQPAAVLSVLLLGSGMALASLVNLTVLLIGATGLLLVVLYDLWLKRVPLLGNLLVAISAGLTFLIGGAAVSPHEIFQLPGPLLPALLALVFHLVREIVKDVQDLEGDRRAGVTTLPEWLGPRNALAVASVLTIGLVVLTVVPYYLHWLGLLYLIIGVGLAELPSLVILVRLTVHPSLPLLRAASICLKLGMVLGLVALVLG